MGIFNRKINNSGLQTPERWLVETLKGEGGEVSPDTALKVAACYACVRYISEQVALMPVNIYQRLPDGGREKKTDIRLYRILNEEFNPYCTAFRGWRMLMVNLTMKGAAYAEIERDPATREPKNLWPIPASRVEKLFHPSGEPYWKVKVPVYRENGNTSFDEEIIPFGNMYELTGIGSDPEGQWLPLKLLSRTLRLSESAEKYSIEYFDNGAHPSGTITYPGRLQGEKLEDFKKNVKAAYSGLGNQHRVMLLEDGMKFERIAAPANEGQMFETRKHQVVECARFFNVPPSKIMDFERATYNNMEEVNKSVVTDTLMPYLKNIKQEAQKELLFAFQKDAGWYIEHNCDALLQGKTLERYQAYHWARQDGWLNANEIRAKENLENIGAAGDEYWRPANMFPPEGGN